jgi:putative transposase
MIDKCSIRLARIIYNHIVNKSRVRFPNLNKPKLVLDSRLFNLEFSKTKSFDYWLKITTLNPGKRISIPIKKNKFFNAATGTLGNTIELDFKYFDYNVIQHKHNSLFKPKVKINKTDKNKLSKQGLIKSNKQIKFIFNKKQLTEDITNRAKKKILTKTVAFDLGLCNLIATDNGELFGKYWLTKLTRYDKKITELFSSRQSCISKYNNHNPTNKLKIRSKRYDKLIIQVKGFIKTEINRILNKYFAKNKDIEIIVIEKLKFTSPELSNRLNRIIQNFGFKIYKDKLEELSLYNGFKIEELNPAYTSQECHECGYVDVNNRSSQAEFKCKCCEQEMNADVNGSRTNIKRFNSKGSTAYKAVSRGIILNELKINFVKEIEKLIINGKVGRRNLYLMMSKNKYYEKDIKIVRTTEALGVEPMTVKNFDKLLYKHYQTINKI